MTENKLHQVSNPKLLTRHYRILPYPDMLEILKTGETAFFEDSKDQPLKRQTMHKAAKRLSELIGEGKKVTATRGFLKINGDENISGYLFTVEDRKS